MNINAFDWDDANVDHIARHNIIPDEVEEIFTSKHFIFRTRSGRYLALGKTAAGRYLTCIFERREYSGNIRVVTAWDMNTKDRKLFKKKVG